MTIVQSSAIMLRHKIVPILIFLDCVLYITAGDIKNDNNTPWSSPVNSNADPRGFYPVYPVGVDAAIQLKSAPARTYRPRMIPLGDANARKHETYPVYYRNNASNYVKKSGDYNDFKPITPSTIIQGPQGVAIDRRLDVAAASDEDWQNTTEAIGRFFDEGRGKLKKKYKKYLLPLLLAYKLKFFTLIPLMMGGLVLLAGATGLAGFFFALFSATMGLKAGSH